MKKVFLFASLLLSLSASAQHDFDYKLTFGKRTVITPVSVGKYDTVVTKMSFTLDKTAYKLTIFGGGGPLAGYTVIFRGIQNGAMIYSAGLADIAVVPYGPVLEVRDGFKQTIYQQ